jgi:DNA polymerase-3 subunit epsilon
MNVSIDQAIQVLNQNDDYQVIQRLPEVESYNKDDESEKKIGIYLDTETTGLSAEKDKIIELGMVVFEYSSTGRIFKVLKKFDAYEDPKSPISTEITALTGITDEMVSGQEFDDIEIESIVNNAALIIAHNAGFDRPFMEKRFPIFVDKAWACSQRDIDWKEEGMGSQKLDYLAYQFGYFFEGHRADIDAAAGLHLLSQKSKSSSNTLLYKMILTARQTSYRIWALNAPFDKKDLLKGRGYRWSSGDDGKKKSWYIDVIGEDALNDEKDFLGKDVYPGNSQASIDEFNAFKRYSSRY